MNIQEGACYWPASEINRPQLLLGQQERRKHHRDQRPQKKKLGHFVFSTSKLRSGKQISFGRQFASVRKFALGLEACVRPVIRVRPDVCVWPGKSRLASKARLASRTMFHQQNDSPPANALTTSNPTSRQQARSTHVHASSHGGRIPTGEQAGPGGTPPKALNLRTWRHRLAPRHDVLRS